MTHVSCGQYFINKISCLPVRRALGNRFACVKRVIRYAAIRVVTTELTITILANIKTVSRSSSRKTPLFRSPSSPSSADPIVCGSRILMRGLRESVVVAEAKLRSLASSRSPLRRRVNAVRKHRRRYSHFPRATSARHRRNDARNLAKFERSDIGATRKHRTHEVVTRSTTASLLRGCLRSSPRICPRPCRELDNIPE